MIDCFFPARRNARRTLCVSHRFSIETAATDLSSRLIQRWYQGCLQSLHDGARLSHAANIITTAIARARLAGQIDAAQAVIAA